MPDFFNASNNRSVVSGLYPDGTPKGVSRATDIRATVNPDWMGEGIVPQFKPGTGPIFSTVSSSGVLKINGWNYGGSAPVQPLTVVMRAPQGYYVVAIAPQDVDLSALANGSYDVYAVQEDAEVSSSNEDSAVLIRVVPMGTPATNGGIGSYKMLTVVVSAKKIISTTNTYRWTARSGQTLAVNGTESSSLGSKDELFRYPGAFMLVIDGSKPGSYRYDSGSWVYSPVLSEYSKQIPLYVKGKTYYAGDVTLYNGSLYRCIVAETASSDTPLESNWEVLAVVNLAVGEGLSLETKNGVTTISSTGAVQPLQGLNVRIFPHKMLVTNSTKNIASGEAWVAPNDARTAWEYYTSTGGTVPVTAPRSGVVRDYRTGVTADLSKPDYMYPAGSGILVVKSNASGSTFDIVPISEMESARGMLVNSTTGIDGDVAISYDSSEGPLLKFYSIVSGNLVTLVNDKTAQPYLNGLLVKDVVSNRLFILGGMNVIVWGLRHTAFKAGNTASSFGSGSDFSTTSYPRISSTGSNITVTYSAGTGASRSVYAYLYTGSVVLIDKIPYIIGGSGLVKVGA